MPEYIQRKCPTCAGRLENINSNKYECRCCHNVYELNERNANLYHDLLDVSAARASLNFKYAEQKCRNLLKEYKDENLADVYWNLLLSEQRVMFETDQHGEQFPSFYDIVPTEIEDSDNYAHMLEHLEKYAPQNKAKYEELVDRMYTAKRKFRKIKDTTKPYDIFICFKKSSINEPNKLTKDYQLAMDLYNKLNDDYRVFFSERSLNNIVVREYEPNIYHALYTAKIMLVLCSHTDYLESQWVKNEWSRFKMMADTTAQAKSIIPIFMDGFQPEQLPYELRSCQGINDDMSLLYNLTQAVKEILRPSDKQAELAAKLKADMQAQMEAQMRAQTEQMNALAKQLAEQNKRLENQNKESTAAYSPSYTPTYTPPATTYGQSTPDSSYSTYSSYKPTYDKKQPKFTLGHPVLFILSFLTGPLGFIFFIAWIAKCKKDGSKISKILAIIGGIYVGFIVLAMIFAIIAGSL